SLPRGAVGVLGDAASWQGLRTIEYGDVIEPEKAAGKEVVAFGVLAIHPPGKVEQQLLRHAFKKRGVALAAWPSHLVNAPSRPCVHGRIHFAAAELISPNLAIAMHVPFTQEQT